MHSSVLCLAAYRFFFSVVSKVIRYHLRSAGTVSTVTVNLTLDRTVTAL